MHTPGITNLPFLTSFDAKKWNRGLHRTVRGDQAFSGLKGACCPWRIGIEGGQERQVRDSWSVHVQDPLETCHEGGQARGVRKAGHGQSASSPNCCQGLPSGSPQERCVRQCWEVHGTTCGTPFCRQWWSTLPSGALSALACGVCSQSVPPSWS